MEKITDFLAERKPLNIGLTFAYFIFILFMHDPLVNLSVWLMNGMTMGVYEVVVAISVIVVILTGGFFFIRNLLRKRNRVGLQIILLVLILGALVVHRKVLLVMNIELIHFFQFGLFTLIVFPMTRKLGVTMLIVTFFAYLDELFQYQWLYPERENYFDFNDVITDQLGMGTALLLLMNAGIQPEPVRPMKEWVRAPWFWVFIACLGGIGVLLATQLVVPYGGDMQAHTLLILNEAQAPLPFWENFMDLGIFYHVLRPWEGFPIHFAFLGVFFLLDKFIERGQ